MSDVRLSREQIICMAVEYAGIKRATARAWIRRGLLIEHLDGFDPDQLVLWVDTIRNMEKAVGAVKATYNRETTRRAS